MRVSQTGEYLIVLMLVYRDCQKGKFALGGLIAFAFWIILVLPFCRSYIPQRKEISAIKPNNRQKPASTRNHPPHKSGSLPASEKTDTSPNKRRRKERKSDRHSFYGERINVTDQSDFWPLPNP
jgi:hypothetical protein